MTSINMGWRVFASLLISFEILLGLSGCSDEPVVIQPGKFSEEWPTALRRELIPEKKCAIDSINGKNPHASTLTFKSGTALNMSGWAFSKTDGAQPVVYAQLIGPALTYTAQAQNRTARSDVNQYFKLDPTWSAGFELQAEQNVEPGEYRLEILQPGEHGVARCDTRVSIKIDP